MANEWGETNPVRIAPINDATSATWVPTSSDKTSAQAAKGIANWNSNISPKSIVSGLVLRTAAPNIPPRTSNIWMTRAELATQYAVWGVRREDWLLTAAL